MQLPRWTWKAVLVVFFVVGLIYGIDRSMAQGAQPNGLTLDQIRAAYDLDPLIQAGMDGSGQTVAIIAQGNVQPSDLQTFAQRYSLPAVQIEQIKVGSAPPSPSAEWSLDTEIIYAIAPKATILVYEGPNILTAPVFSGAAPNALNRVLTDGRANVISMSYDACEFALSNAQARDFDALTEKVHQAGITLYKGAGDNGAYWCAKDPSSPYAAKLSVGAATSDPYVTSVGGTTLSVANGQYQSEVVWSNPTKKTGTGGGLSSRWPIPAYQKPYQLTDLNPNGMRQLPDIAADADPMSGFPFYCTVADSTCHGWANTGGDSATGPLWTGATALINQYLATVAGGPFHVQGPDDFYALETAYQAGKVAHAPFHDVTQGDNLYYKARVGYDLTTGLGTPDFYAIALDLAQLDQAKAAS